VYHKVREDLEAQGVLFLDTDTALQKHEDLFREHFTKVIPANDNKFAALNTAVWSGGSFIWVPEGVKVDIPLQAYFRINQQNMGQFERTLIIAEPGSYIHYVEGCLPAGELIGTADGDWRSIETIEVGEHVLTHEGRPARVTAIQARDYRGPLYTFQPISPDSAFSVTEEHPLLVVRDGGEPEWVEAKDVRESDLLVFPKPRPQPAETVLPLELGRLAGYYLALGSATASGETKTVAFVLSTDDHDSLEEIRRLCKDLYDAPGSLRWDEAGRHATLLVESKAAYEALRHLGSDRLDKNLPRDFFRQDTGFLRALVETYLRGHDCTVRAGAIRHRVQTGSRTWAHQLQAVLARLDVFAAVSEDGGYAVEWSTAGRGEVRARDAGDHFLVPVKKRTVTEFDGQVYNLDVEAPDSYLASGFAVHNCTAPIYSSDSLHSAVVEIIVKPGARVRYTTIQNWSNNVYNLVTKRAAAYEDSTMEWVDANIGCLAQGSRVTTRGGVKAIEELTPGEEVLSYDEERGELCFRTVTAKKYSGEQPVREVRVGQRSLKVTDNHPFLSSIYDPEAPKKLGRYKLGYVRADELDHAIVPTTSIDYGVARKLELPEASTTFTGKNQYAEGFTSVRSRTPRLNIGEETTDELMWLLGLYVGDGSIDSEPAANGGLRWGRVVFSVPQQDRARARLTEVMDGFLPGAKPTERADGVTVTWNSVELVELFERNGFTTGARAKRLPDWVLDLPESQRLSFVAGYLDSDGCAPRGRRGFSIKSVNRDLLEDTADVLTSLGIPSRLHTEFDEERQVQAVGNSVTARGAHRLELRADPRLVSRVTPGLQQAVAAQEPVKLHHFRTIGRSNIELPEKVEVRKVDVSEHLATVPTWDIEVEGTGNFVAEGFIVHNSKLTMKYPAVWLMGRGAKGDVLSVAFAGDGQHQDAGAKMVHHAPDTSSNIVSKSVSQGTGRTSYRGLVDIEEGAHRVKASVVCDALLLDETARSDTYPYMSVREDDAQIGHEASVSKVGEEQLFYLQSRGIPESEALAMIVRGFIEPIAKELPMEYAVELNRLISLNMEGSVG
jgi:Fe-S cluster assembly scaffold protein SufB